MTRNSGFLDAYLSVLATPAQLGLTQGMLPARARERYSLVSVVFSLCAKQLDQIRQRHDYQAQLPWQFRPMFLHTNHTDRR